MLMRVLTGTDKQVCVCAQCPFRVFSFLKASLTQSQIVQVLIRVLSLLTA